MGKDARPVGKGRQCEARSAEVAGSEGGQVARRPHVVHGPLRDLAQVLRLPRPLAELGNQGLDAGKERGLIELSRRNLAWLCRHRRPPSLIVHFQILAAVGFGLHRMGRWRRHAMRLQIVDPAGTSTS